MACRRSGVRIPLPPPVRRPGPYGPGLRRRGGELSESDRRPFVFADLDAVGERLIRQALALVVRARVKHGAIGQQAEGRAELFACSGVVVVFAGEAAVDIGEAGLGGA